MVDTTAEVETAFESAVAPTVAALSAMDRAIESLEVSAAAETALESAAAINVDCEEFCAVAVERFVEMIVELLATPERAIESLLPALAASATDWAVETLALWLVFWEPVVERLALAIVETDTALLSAVLVRAETERALLSAIEAAVVAVEINPD